MISLVDLGWTPDFKSFFLIQEYFSFLSEDLVPLECLFRLIDYNLLSQKVIFTNVIPIFISLIFLFAWGVISITCSNVRFLNHTDQGAPLMDKLKVSVIIIMVLLFPEIMRKSLGLLNCIYIENTHETRVLIYSPDTVCWQGDHIHFILSAALPGLIVWGLFVPLIMMFNLLKYRRSIRKAIKGGIIKVEADIATTKGLKLLEKHTKADLEYKAPVAKPGLLQRKKKLIFPECSRDNNLKKNLKDLINLDGNIFKKVPMTRKPKHRQNPNELSPFQTKSGKLDINHHRSLTLINFRTFDKEFRMSVLLKFLYRGYSARYYYWEVLIFAKKLALIGIGCISDVFPPPLKAIFLLLIIIFFLFIQTHYSPYETVFLNRIESFSLITTFITANVGVMMFTHDLRDFAPFFLAFIILINGIFICYWCFAFWKYALNQASPRKIFRIFKRSKSKTPNKIVPLEF